MIEFKAECGHTVRARDEDAGGVVRCSYCGRPANVPDETADELDFLFNEIEAPTEDAARRKRRLRIPGAGIFAKRSRHGEFNPFPVVLRLCYAALLIIIVIFVGRMYVLPLIQRIMERQPIVVPVTPVRDDPNEQDPNDSPQRQERYGLLTEDLEDGMVYVFVTPPSDSARICFIEESDTLGPGPFYRDDGCTPCSGGRCDPGVKKRDRDKKFIVEVALRIGDSSLAGYPGHRDLRRQVRSTSSEAIRNRLVERFFIPDRGTVLFHEADGQEFLIRQYRNVAVHKREPKVVRALLLPRIAKPDGLGFSVERLVQDNFIPNEVNYGLRLEAVENELDLDEIPKSDQAHIVRALKRIGVISYVRPDKQTRWITIDVRGGWVGAENISDANP
jgi:hypothetical protein